MSQATEIETKSQLPHTIYLKDYQPPEYSVESLDLNFNIQKTDVQITAISQVVRSKGVSNDFVLQGSQQVLLSLKINGVELEQDQFDVCETGLTIKASAVNFDRFELRIKTKVDPFNNTSLEGLYDSKGMLCTQCYAEGYRRITYYVDRQDNMAVFTTLIEADKDQKPNLFTN
jgi:aminopeptidase N